MTTTPVSAKEGEPAKKRYERPRLEVYGNIREVTSAVGMTGALDGMAHGNTKTM